MKFFYWEWGFDLYGWTLKFLASQDRESLSWMEKKDQHQKYRMHPHRDPHALCRRTVASMRHGKKRCAAVPMVHPHPQVGDFATLAHQIFDYVEKCVLPQNCCALAPSHAQREKW